MKRILDWNKYLEKAAQTVSEGIVMLKNEGGALPLDVNETVSVFGRIQLHYYKSGTGSGGMVNVTKVTGILDGLLEAGVKINEELLEIYRKWDEENPYELGEGWGAEPWSQKEMPLDDDVVKKAASVSSKAVVIIGRTAGEEQDARAEEGSYLLTSVELDMLKKVRAHFDKVIVLLNVGGLIDLNDIESTSPDALLFVWQGGMTGGTGTADVLTGKTSPSGKLPDTIAKNVSDYPSDPYFGNKTRNCYTEDIFVGYRWFESFAKDNVLYPFGFGLSYTTFSIETSSVSGNDILTFSVKVTNTGSRKGKEVVQLYVEKPQGALGQPARVLCGFAKTKELLPDEAQDLSIVVKMSDIASYDDSGAAGEPYCWILEEGKYNFCLGSDVRSASPVFTKELPEKIVVQRCSQALAPVEDFERIKAVCSGDKLSYIKEQAPLSKVDEAKRLAEGMPAEIPYTGDKGIKLIDVRNGKNTMNEFIAQLSDHDLSCIIRGEGMGSPRVTAGTASAFGGVSDTLNEFGVPAACCSDGPSGMRLDCGTKAFSLPNGTLIASTFNRELVEELFEFMGTEMVANKVDCLLGPGMNIHRHPLNGRNFEYFSEDPYLTGHMAAAELRGLHKVGVTGTVKHFCANNQEKNRHSLDSAASERALREIYLKGYEIAVREGNADSIMTTYGAVNGLWTAGNYDLNTIVLRNEWGFKGFTMTDWWANVNYRGEEPERSFYVPMARAQNDVYMVCSDSSCVDESIMTALENGKLTRAELQRNAANILGFLLGTNALKRMEGEEDTVEIINRPDGDEISDKPVVFYDLNKKLSIDLSGVRSVKGQNYSFALTVEPAGWYKVTVTASSTQSPLAQIPITLFSMGTPSGTLTWNGTDGKPVSYTTEIPMFSRFTAMRIYFAQNGLDLHSIEFELTRTTDSMDAAFVTEED
ncbi:MAG: glycoside hydrolase family 3 C-terminal domain-containing protein [Ruminococcus sp.]|uniref:glycoside hydrolase family 3 protein n=1 Tax=Ruminococcus sp. TaxID=41978 RepID=UPI0025EB36B8|nr:glycoside hydrolase family 3 protein [Ruminococcus sp.]MCR5601845.1 glycoside hydrolase family 3 C-terminal domain-containing protein [Ruminococcus sp.]